MIPAFIITGFLGSGKTTLIINAAKKHLNDKKVAIIVNEFGEVGVDGKILSMSYSKVVELSEGCVCCTLHGEFEKALSEIRENYNPDVLIVETSGAAEPFPIMVSLQNLECTIEGVICVIDAKNFDKYKDDKVAKHQIGSSNILVLNKIDLVENTDSLDSELLKIWEENKLKNLFTGETIFENVKIYKTSYGDLPKEVFSGIFVLNTKINVFYNEEHDHSSLNQKVIFFEKPINFEYIKDLTKDSIRAKGIVKLEGTDIPYLINYAFGYLDMMPIESYNKDKFFLVLIGENV